MAPISFRCTTCDHVLKVNADRTGRKVKCGRCNSIVVVPAANGPVADVVEAAPAPVKKPSDDDDDGPNDGKGYGMLIDPKEEEDRKRRLEEAHRANKKKIAPAALKRRIKSIYDVDEWKKARIGIAVLLGAVAFWGLQYILHELVFLIGLIQGPEYADLVDAALFTAVADPNEWPKPGSTMPLDRMGFAISLISGSDFRALGKVFIILGEAFLVVTGCMFLTSYFFFRGIPSRFGSGRLTTALIVLGCVNLVIALFGRLLPAATGFGPMLIPLVAPEVPIVAANIERSLPLHVFWMHSPFWETLLTMLAQLCFWTEPVLIAVLIWTLGKLLKEHSVEEQGHGLTELAAGVYFIAFAYLMLSLAGTSVVLVIMLRVVYTIWAGFVLGYLIRFAIVLNNTRVLLDKLITDSDEEERRTGKKKLTGRIRRDDEDEDDEENEEDED